MRMESENDCVPSPQVAPGLRSAALRVCDRHTSMAGKDAGAVSLFMVSRVQETAKGAAQGVGAGMAYIKERATAPLSGAGHDEDSGSNLGSRPKDSAGDGGGNQCAP